jgi:hypothetical protein
LNWLTKLTRPGPLDVYFRKLDDDELAHAEGAFFGALRLSNGTYKTTLSDRLDDVNELIADLLPRGRRLQVMDVGVSSGITTAEWSDQLRARRINHDLFAGDLAPSAILLTVGQHAAALWQEDGHPLAVQVGRRCLYLGRARAATSMPRCALAAVYRLIVGRMHPAAYEARPAPWTQRVRPVGLVSRRLASRPTVQVVPDDIRRAGRFAGRADVCRAANVLNRSYFGDDEIRTMARNLLDRLTGGGLLAVCRTHEEGGRHVNRATVLRKVDRSLEVVGRLNGGSDVEDLLLAAGLDRDKRAATWSDRARGAVRPASGPP